MTALGRGDLPRPRVGRCARIRKDQLKTSEATAKRGDLKPVAAMDHNACDQRVDANRNDVRALLQHPPQGREMGLLPLPPWDFDANSLGRQVDHEGPVMR